MIFCIILAGIIFIIIKLLSTPVVYFDRTIDSLNKFLYILKFRGNADESIQQNTILTVICPDRTRGIGIVIYKKNGRIRLYLTINETDLDGRDNKFLKKVENNCIEYFIWADSKEKIYVLDMNLNFKKIKGMLEFIWVKIFEEKVLLDLHFTRDIRKKPGKLIDFKDAKELDEKGINIDIPVTKGQWLIYKLKGKKTCP